MNYLKVLKVKDTIISYLGLEEATMLSLVLAVEFVGNHGLVVPGGFCVPGVQLRDLAHRTMRL